VKEYHLLEGDWKSMESYIRSLNEYQAHVEHKYALLLNEYQQVILNKDSLESDDERLSQNFLNSEQEESYQKMLQIKDEELALLKEDKQKRDKVIETLNSRIQ
jgi:uncharacterized protein (DUF3084 family)